MEGEIAVLISRSEADRDCRPSHQSSSSREMEESTIEKRPRVFCAHLRISLAVQSYNRCVNGAR